MTAPPEEHDRSDGRASADAHTEHARRDADVLFVMGGFFLLLGLCVLIATQWDKWNEPIGALNIAAAVGLLVVGVVTALFAFRLRGRSRGGNPPDTP